MTPTTAYRALRALQLLVIIIGVYAMSLTTRDWVPGLAMVLTILAITIVIHTKYPSEVRRHKNHWWIVSAIIIGVIVYWLLSKNFYSIN